MVQEKKEIIKLDIPFFIYFTLMFCLYKFTYFQLGIQIVIILYFALILIKRKLRITHKQIKNMLFFVSWYGAFTALMFLSQMWAYGIKEGPSTLLTALRTFAIGFLIFYISDSRKKALSVFKSFIAAFFVVTVVVLVLTPASQWGNEHVFGKMIAQHRNTLGTVSAPLILVCYYYYKNFGMRYGLLIAAYFSFFTVICGSRGAWLQVIIIFLIHLLINEKDLSKKLKNLIVSAVVAVVIVLVIVSVPFLYELVWVRFGNAASTVLGIEVVDSSTVGREKLREVATLMFLQRPLLGYGVDGVVCFLRDYSKILGEEVAAVYSHCNYTEIAACFGIVGLIIYYVPILRTIFLSFKKRNQSKWAGVLFATFVSMNVMDYCRINWSTHMVMYLFFCIMLIIRYEDAQIVDCEDKIEKRNLRDEGMYSNRS